MVKLTKQLINEARTPRGGFTSAQARVFGFQYNQKKWTRKLVGMEVSWEQYQKFKSAAFITSKKKQSRRKPKPKTPTVKLPEHLKPELSRLISEITSHGVTVEQIASFVVCANPTSPAAGHLTVAQLRKLNYRQEYLKTDHWKAVRNMVLGRDFRTCRHCGSRKMLEVHHTTYRNLGHEQDCLSDLITLCCHCHKKTHGL